jgi:hypothetical protein
MGLASLSVGVRAASEASFRKPRRSMGVSDVQPRTGELEFVSFHELLDDDLRSELTKRARRRGAAAHRVASPTHPRRSPSSSATTPRCTTPAPTSRASPT